MALIPGKLYRIHLFTFLEKRMGGIHCFSILTDDYIFIPGDKIVMALEPSKTYMDEYLFLYKNDILTIRITRIKKL